MTYPFTIVDVFSRSPFGGNQLAVLMNARGLSAEGMQKIAREFNFTETTFVMPVENEADRFTVRIFTPTSELAFAGHPTVGTACAIVLGGYAGSGDAHSLILDEGIGPVAVSVEKRAGVLHGTLTISGEVDRPGGAPSCEEIATVLSLRTQDVEQVFFAGVGGLPFCFVQLVSREAVDLASVEDGCWKRYLADAWSSNVFFFAGELNSDGALYARMSAPGLGVREDPATGSACAALVGALAASPEFTHREYRLSIQQGVAMGRRSDIEASASKIDGTVTSIRVSGATAHVASGEIEVPDALLLLHDVPA